jgi:HK97 gp10 family phage protein
MSKQDLTIKWDQPSFDGMIRKLERFDRRVRNKVIRETVREAGDIFVKEIKSATPQKTGLLKRNIKQKVKTKRNYIYSIFGAKWIGESGTTRGKNPAIYIHVLEHGGRKRSRGTKPFAREAFKRKRGKGISLVKRRLIGAFDRALELSK